MCPGCLPTGEFLPAENDKNNAHSETADQEAEISVLSQRLEHAIRLTQRGATSQRWRTASGGELLAAPWALRATPLQGRFDSCPLRLRFVRRKEPDCSDYSVPLF